MADDAASWLVRGRVASGGVVTDDGWVLVDGPRIAALGRGAAPECAITVDLDDAVLCPGFVDIHVHGGGGAQVGGDSPAQVAAAVRTMAAFHLRHGTTSLVPTTVSAGAEQLRTAVIGISQAMAASTPGEPSILGSHLEGPWLAAGRAGAHDSTQLRDPDPDALRALINASGNTIRLVTFAPERPRAIELVAVGRSADVTMSIGHTDATFEEARAALAAGARHLTHAGNAMPPIDRRAPGPIAAVLADRSATFEVIADGEHLHPGFLALLCDVGRDRLIAVTDAMAACGMPSGHYRLGAADVVVGDGRVVLSDEPTTLAGSVLTMDRAVATLVAAGMDLGAAVQAATGTPAAVVGAHAKGQFRTGADADLVVLDRDLRAVSTVIGGLVAADSDGRLSAAGVGSVSSMPL